MEVDVYWNLHKKCFSVRDRKTRRVVAHKQHVLVYDPLFVVSEAGRQRVLREQRKNVHAFIRGTSDLHDYYETLVSTSTLPEVTYNPYNAPSFTLKTSGEPIWEGAFAFLTATDHGPEVRVRL